MRFGEGLRSERERRGIALDDIAVATRVSLRNLSALESERFTELPGGVFNRGIVRSYARFCGMDEDATVNAYTDALRQQGMAPEAENDDWVAFAENVRRNRITPMPQQRLRWVGVAAMVIAVLAFAGGVLVVLVKRGVVQLPPRLQAVIHLRHNDAKPEAPPTSPSKSDAGPAQ